MTEIKIKNGTAVCTDSVIVSAPKISGILAFYRAENVAWWSTLFPTGEARQAHDDCMPCCPSPLFNDRASAITTAKGILKTGGELMLFAVKE